MTNIEPEINSTVEETVNISLRAIAYFTERGFTSEQIRELERDGVRDVSKEENLKACFHIWDKQKQQHISADGMLFPGVNQVRFFEPVEVNGKKVKCLTASGKPMTALNPDAPVITEGYADAMAGTMHGGILTGALPGVSGARKLLKEGSKQTISFDSDGWSNPSVFLALIYAGLHTGGKVCILPEIAEYPKAGLCEYFMAGHTAEDYKKLIESAYTPKALLLEWPNHWQNLPGTRLSRALNYACRLGAEFLDEAEQELLINRISKNTPLSKRLIKQKLAKYKRILDRKAEEFERRHLESLGLVPPAPASNKTPTPMEYGLELSPQYEAHWRFDLQQQTWRCYEPKKGFWEIKHDAEIEGIITDESLKRGVKFADLSFIKKVCDVLKNRLRITQWHQQSRSNFVNFRNCVLDVSTGQIFPHSPHFQFTSCLERDYNPIPSLPADPIEALRQHAPIFYQYASDSMGGNERKIKKLLAVIAGVLKFKFSELQFFIHLIGPQGTGKSVFAKILGEIIGQQNTEATSIEALTGNNPGYEFANIINKQLVIAADEDSASKNLGRIKKMVGNDLISYRQIQKPVASGRFMGALLVTSNYPIFCTSKSSGLDRRLCLIEFPNQVPVERRNSSLEELISPELSAITSIALSLQDSEIAELIKGIGEGSVADNRIKAWDMKCRSNSVAAWMNDWVIQSPGERVPVSRLYESYKEKATEAGERNQLKRESFSTALQDICRDTLQWEVKSGRTCQHRYIEGVRIRNEADSSHPFIEDIIGHDNPMTPYDSPMTASMTASNPDTVSIMTAMTGKTEVFADSEKNNLNTESEVIPAEENINISADTENTSAELSYPSQPSQDEDLGLSSTLSSTCHEAVTGLSPAQVEQLSRIREAMAKAKDWNEYQAMLKDSPSFTKKEKAAIKNALTESEQNHLRVLKQSTLKPTHCRLKNAVNAAIWEINHWLAGGMIQIKTNAGILLDYSISEIEFINKPDGLNPA